MTRMSSIRADSKRIEVDCRIDGVDGMLVIERTQRGKLRIELFDGFDGPVSTLGRRKAAALTNWLAATQGIEPDGR